MSADAASGALERYIVKRVIWSLIHLKRTYDETFERLFGSGRGRGGDLNTDFPKIQMPGGLPGVNVEASI